MAIGCVVLLTMMVMEKCSNGKKEAESQRVAETPEGCEVDKIIRCVTEGREIQGDFTLLHRVKGGIKMLIGAAFTFLSSPKELHAMARYIFDQESQLHGRASKKEVLRCLRSKGWSNKETSELLDHIEEPGCLKKTEYWVCRKSINTSKFFLLRRGSPQFR